MSVFAYTRVSKGEPDSLGLEAQRTAILDRFPEAEVVQEVASARRADNREKLAEIRRQLRRGDTLVVARLDRLARSVTDFGHIIEESVRRGWDIVVLDQQLDTTTANGRLVANVLASVAQWEREMIAERTRAALRARGCGIPVEIRKQVIELGRRGLSQRAIAAAVNLHKESVARVLRSNAVA
jgi:DNA invertase Pin-like site-specific DNA recombinase